MDKLALLTPWLASFHRIEAVYASLKQLTQAAPESPLVRALYDTLDQYTKTLAQLLGDTDGALEWFLWENDGGKKAMAVKLAHWPEPRPITTLEDLLTILP